MPSRIPLIFALLVPLCSQAQSTISVADFGAQPDGILRTDGAITAGSNLLTSASGTFSPADTGKYIQIIGAGNGGTTHSDGVMASGSTTLTSISGTFATPPKDVLGNIVGLSIDVGRSIVVVGAGAGGQNLITHIAKFNSSSSVTLVDPAISATAGATYFYGAMTLEGTIQSVQNSGSVILSTPAVATISNATYAYGTNFSANFQQAVDAAGQAGGATVLVPGATNCPAGAACGYVTAATDQTTAHAPGAVKIRYNNVSLVGSDPQTNLFCRGAWGLYSNIAGSGAAYAGQTAEIRGTCIAIGDDQGPNGAAGRSLSNITVAKLHLYGMTDGNTYNNQYTATSPPLTTTGDGWDTTHKAIALWQPSSTFSNILIDSVYIQDFKGENIYSGGSTVTGMVIQNSTLTNFNGDGISILAADLQVINNTITNGSNAGIEDSTVSVGSKALVRQLYQGNTISDFPLEAIVIAGVDTGVAAGAVQIINNAFDTIGQINAFSGGVAIAIKPQVPEPQQDPLTPNKPPANVTIAGNTCHDCYAFTSLQTSGHSQVRNNTIVVDRYSAGDLINLSFQMNDIVIANNSGYRTADAIANGRRVADVYNLHWANSTLSWTKVSIHDNNWNFPGSYHYQFITDAAGWGAVTSQNIVWQNETCTGCVYEVNHGKHFVADSLTIPPFGPVVQVQNSYADVNVTVDASKEQDGAELTIIASGSKATTFYPDANLALSGPLTVSGGPPVLFRYNGLLGKFVVAQRPTTISANSNATPQSVAANNAFGNALAATVLDSANNPVEGILVEFKAPASGASGTFANATNTTTALTDATGVATASVFSANSLAGPYTVTATASGVATPANFSLTNLPPPVPITVQTSPTGQSFTVDNIAYASSQTFQWTPNSTHTIGTTGTQAGSTGTQFVYTGWSDSGAISHSISAPNSAATYTANFNTQYQLTTSVNPAQGGTVTAGGWFNSGSGVQMQATPNPGYQFGGFSGDLTGTTNPQALLMNAPTTVIANFASPQTITFGALSDQALGSAPFTVSAIASSGLSVIFNSQTTSFCTVSGSSVTLTALGTCTIQATQAGDNTNYLAATPVNQSFQVVRQAIQSQIITFGALTSQVFGAPPFALNATATSGLPVSFASTTPAVCTVSGGTVTLTAAASCTIQATQSGDGNYSVAPPVNQSLQVIAPGLGTYALLVGSSGGSSSAVLAYGSAWTAAANDDFLHISAGSGSGTGSAVVVFTCDPFSGTGTRTGTLIIAGFTLTVTQAGTNYVGPGPVTTLVSSGLNVPRGIAVDGSGNVYIADQGSGVINKWSASTQQVTTLLAAGLNEPFGVAVDGSGNVYVADSGNNAIKEWSASTQQVTTLVSSGLQFPTGVAVDGSGNVYIADTNNNAIKEWNASTQQVTTLVSAGLNEPYGVAVDGSGNVYFADSGNNAIKEWSASTQQVTTLVGSGLGNPYAVAVDGSGNVYIGDYGSGTIKEWSASMQQLTTLVASGVGDPYTVAVDGSGNIYIEHTLPVAIKEIPNVFVGPASLTEPASTGSDSLLQVLPATTSLIGIFAPTSDQSWLTIGTIASGVISFSFTANTSGATRVAHIAVLGQQITVTQDGLATQPPSINSGNSTTFTVGVAGSFTVTATGSPSPALSENGSLPNGVTFNVATQVLSGAPAAGTNGTYNITFTASNGVGSNAVQNFTLTVNLPTVLSVTLNPASLPGGIANATGTVTLNAGAVGTTAQRTVTLSSDNIAAATVPASVTLTAGATSANFTVTSHAVATTATANISGTLNGGTQGAALTVIPPPAVASVTLNPASVLGGSANSTATVTLTAPAQGTAAQRTVTLSSSITAAATVPAGVTLAAGATTASFPVTSHVVAAVATPVITATLNGSTTATLTVNPFSIVSVSLNPASVSGGITNATGTVTLNAPAVGTVAQRTVTLSSGNIAAATVPATVIVNTSATSANFTVTSHAVATTATANISATLNGGTQDAALTVTPPPGVASLTLNPASVLGGSANSTATVTLNAPAVGTAAQRTVTPSSSITAAATVPASVTVAAGATTVTFPVTSQVVAVVANPVITATLNGSATATLAVNPFSIVSLTLNPASVPGGITNATGTVTLNAPAVGTVAQRTVTLSSGNNAAATVPASVTVNAGATSANFTVTSHAVAATATANISGTLNGGTQGAALAVTPPPGVASLTLNPASVLGGSANSTATVTLNAPAVGTTAQRTVTLSSSNTAAATVPGTVTVNAGATSATFTITSKVVTAVANPVITATLNGSATVTLAVNPLLVTSLILNPTSVTGGTTNSTATVTLNGVAAGTAAQRTLTISSTNTGAATVPATIAVPVGATSVNFTVTSKAVSVTGAATISVAIHGSAQNAVLTVTP